METSILIQASVQTKIMKQISSIRKFICLFLILAKASLFAQTGYIYVHKKALDELSSTNFNFSVTGGTTVVPAFTLNDNPAQTTVLDIGASENGRLWAASRTGALYYRNANSTTWNLTNVTGVAKVDGASGDSCYYINSAGTIFSFNVGTGGPYAISTTGAFSNGGGWNDIASGWTGTPTSSVVTGPALYVVRDLATVYKWNGPGTTTWGVYATIPGSVQYRIDVNPTNGNVYVGGNAGSVRTIRQITPAAAPVVTSLGSPFPDNSAYRDVAVNQNGEIYVTGHNQVVPIGNFVHKFISGTTWTRELGSFDAQNITGGVSNSLWTTMNSGGHNDAVPTYPFYNIFSRATDGTEVIYIDDERVRETTGNSQLIPVVPGTYTITEAAAAGWDLQKILIYDPTANSTSNQVAGTATINVSAGEVVHVVYQNGIDNPFVMTNSCSAAYLETFGTGAVGTFGLPATGQTSYHYLNGNAKGEDGHYKIVNRGPDFNTWPDANLIVDHTPGDADQGYMYAVNAGFDKGEFFRRRFIGVVPGATYNFSAWIVDLTPTGPVNPNVSFLIYDHTSQALLGSYSTGELTSTAVPDAWQQYGFTFTATAADIDLVIANNGFGGNGNDLALDDISFTLIPGGAPVTTVANTACGTSGSITVTSPVGSSFEYSKDGTTWQQYPATTFSNLAPGSYTIYARMIGTVGCTASKVDFVAATICGNVWNDVNGNAINSGENPIASGVWINLVDPITHVVLQSVQVDASGNYSFTGLPQNANYQIILSSSDQTGNTNLTGSTLPAGYAYTGTNLSGTASTTTNTGVITVNTGTGGLVNQNFGIQQPPTAVTNTLPGQVNPGGTNSVPVPANYFDGNDQNGGIVTSITITSFPANATTITINGITYYDPLNPPAITTGMTAFPGGGVTIPTDINGNPLQAISVDPIDGIVSVVIDYIATDNAGAPSAIAKITVPFTTILPLHLISFVGQVQNAGIVFNWVTANEQNVKWHIIQKSSDAVNYIDIDTVTARNLPADTYSALDAKPYACKNYYRLRSVDIDGKQSLSGVVLIQNDCKKVNFILYPNPVSDQLNISGLKAGEQIQLYSTDGRLLVTQKVTASTQQLDMSKFARGIYEVIIINAAERVFTTKIIKY